MAIFSHRRRILSTTRGHPGRWSDKTLIRFDGLANQLRKGERYADLQFTFLEAAADGTVKEVKYSGTWTIVDNGYLQWSVTTWYCSSNESVGKLPSNAIQRVLKSIVSLEYFHSDDADSI